MLTAPLLETVYCHHCKNRYPACLVNPLLDSRTKYKSSKPNTSSKPECSHSVSSVAADEDLQHEPNASETWGEPQALLRRLVVHHAVLRRVMEESSLRPCATQTTTLPERPIWSNGMRYSFTLIRRAGRAGKDAQSKTPQRQIPKMQNRAMCPL